MKSNIKKQLRLLSEGKEGKFTEWCKKNGFEGPNIGCAKKAYDASPEAKKMAVFYMNTVQPKGKDASVLKEGINSKKYTTEVSPSVYLDGNFYNGKEYDLIDIADNSIDKLSYSIDIEDKEWGIKNIYVYNITGDEEIELDLYLVDKNGEETFETAIIPISWDNVDITEETEQNMITLDKDVSIYLKNDNEGNIFVDKIGVTVLKF